MSKSDTPERGSKVTELPEDSVAIRNERRERMKEIVERFQEYVATYSDQALYADYSDNVFIHDMLYGIGVALDPEDNRFADGYRKFREELKNIL